MKHWIATILSFIALTTVAIAEMIDLTDSQGRLIRATPLRIDNGKVTILRDDGSHFEIPLTQLTRESQVKIEEILRPAEPVTDRELPSMGFTDDGHGNLRFNTGVVKGLLKKDGKADFLTPISFLDPNVPMHNNHGLLVPYRFLTPQKRYGFGSWEWPRTGQILPGGAAELAWPDAPDRPFRFTATYTWKAANTLDFTIAFTPSVDLEKFELFVGSYFNQFNKALVYVKDAGKGKPGFVDTPAGKGRKQLFPRDQEVTPIIKDGRWQHPPYPNNWTFRSELEAPLGIKSQPKSGVAVVIMAPPEDCFAVSMFEQNSKLGCYYLSLFGKDVKKGQTLIGHARMVFGKNITTEEALRMYQIYLKGLR